MIPLLVVAGVILVGVIFLLRNPSAAPPPATLSEADKKALRNAVLDRLRERMVGWTFEAPVDEPARLMAQEVGSDKRIDMYLDDLAEKWFPLFSTQRFPEADAHVESFVMGVSGQDEGTDEKADEAGLQTALALRLMPPDKVPDVVLRRPAGSLVAILVLRRPGGVDAVTADDLKPLNLSEVDAFRIAFENLCADVEEGLDIESLDEEHPKDALAIAPGDPVATSYVLVPALAAKMRKSLGNRDGRLYLDTDGLVAAVADVEVERGTPLVEGALAPDALAWKAVPA